MRGARKYCAVYGCLNSSSSVPGISFFSLPPDDERRSKWLRLISREDLVHRPPQNYTVCEEHFTARDVLPGKRRKKLKTNSLPCLHLPDLQKQDVQISTEALTVVEKKLQTNETKQLVSDSTQTSASLSSNSPRKRKLKPNLLERRKKFRKLETDKYEMNIFLKLCDKFLTKELANLVKAETRQKFHNTGNR